MNWSRRLSVALALSVALNLLFAGIWIGSRFREHHHPKVLHGRRGPFPPALAEAMAGRHAELAEQRSAVAKARAEAEAVLAREPFDRAALDRSLSELRQKTQTTQEVLHRAIGDTAAKLPVERRRELGRALLQVRVGRRGADPGVPPHPLRDRLRDPSAD